MTIVRQSYDIEVFKVFAKNYKKLGKRKGIKRFKYYEYVICHGADM